MLRNISGKKPVISAWFFSHMHSDHVGAFSEIANKHFDEIIINNIYFAFPTRKEIISYEDASVHTYDLFFENFELFKHLCHVVKKGEAFEIDNIRIEALFVPLNRYSDSKNFNNSSVVYRMDACGQSMLFLGDLAEDAQNDLLSETPHNKMSADIVQMAHHGQQGVQKIVYETIRPKCCFWDCPDWLWDNDPGTGFDTGNWQTVIVRGWMKELGVKHNIVHKNGTQKLVLPANFNDTSWGQES